MRRKKKENICNFFYDGEKKEKEKEGTICKRKTYFLTRRRKTEKEKEENIWRRKKIFFLRRRRKRRKIFGEGKTYRVSQKN